MSAIVEVDYFNSFWLKRLQTGPVDVESCSPLVPGNVPNVNSSQTWPGPCLYGDAFYVINDIAGGYNATVEKANIYIEESRIRGGYNNVQTDYGARAYLNEDNPTQKHRENAIIYSGSFNSNTGFNQTNVFSSAESITKAVDPGNGSIQKLYAEDTNLIVFQENKVSRALIDKDAIYSAEGGGSVTSSNAVIGQIVPYVGDFGISKNPESFAVYGFRKYFTDKYRNTIMRLSRDGLTEISQYGMIDYFRDTLPAISDTYVQRGSPFTLSAPLSAVNSFNIPISSSSTSTALIGAEVEVFSSGAWSNPNNITITNITNVFNAVTGELEELTINISDNITVAGPPDPDQIRFVSWTKGYIVGGWDIHTKQYHVSLQDQPYFYDRSLSTYATLAFDESVLGWTSFFTYKPNLIDSLKDKFYSTVPSSTGPGLYQHNYQGLSNNRNIFYGEAVQPEVTFVFNPQPDLSKNFLTINYEGSSGWKVIQFDSDYQEPQVRFDDDNGKWVPNFTSYVENYDKIAYIPSLYEGKYEANDTSKTGANALTPPFEYAGFKVKENLYVANLVNESTPRANEVLFNTNSLYAWPASGIKANYATVTMTTDSITDPNAMKELFAVSTTFSKSGF